MSAPTARSDALAREFREALHRFVLRRVDDAADAEDLTQEILARLHRASARGDAIEDPRAWLFAVARNALRDHWRATRSRRAAMERVAAQPQRVAEAQAQDEVEADLVCCIRPLIDELEADDPASARALRQTELGPLAQREAAVREGISLSGMKSRVQRARGKLRRLLEACCQIEVDARGAPSLIETRGACACRCAQSPEESPDGSAS